MTLDLLSVHLLLFIIHIFVDLMYIYIHIEIVLMLMLSSVALILIWDASIIIRPPPERRSTSLHRPPSYTSGLCLEKIPAASPTLSNQNTGSPSTNRNTPDREQEIINCYEKSGDIALLYLQEAEKVNPFCLNCHNPFITSDRDPSLTVGPAYQHLRSAMPCACAVNNLLTLC